MDQIVERPRTETGATDIAAALSLEPERNSGRRRGKWFYGLLVVALAAAGFASWQYLGQSSPRAAFVTVPAARGDMTVEVSATGALQPLTQVDISSELSGIVRSVAVNENQRVSKGDVLAELDPQRLAAQVERGEASVKAADAKVADARTTLKETEQALDRAMQLAARKLTTDQAIEAATAARDRATSALDSAEANRDIAAADLKLQQADLTKSTIYAPIDGIVLTRSVDPGQTVASSLQAPVLFVIAAELENMELKAAIDEADIGAVKPGQKATFTVDAYPERSFDAEIRDIAYASVTTEGVVTYDARLDVDNRDLLLRPGMTATVAVVTKEAKDIITVPSAAFRYRPPQTERRSGWSLQNLFMPRMRRGREPRDTAPEGMRTLYVLRAGQPQAVHVRTGASDGEMTEIVSGLEVGDQVITGNASSDRAGR
jgi:HlyD family secretion protein